VCGFVPSYILPNKIPKSLDPFLSPIVTDLEDAFINGTVAAQDMHAQFLITEARCMFFNRILLKFSSIILRVYQ